MRDIGKMVVIDGLTGLFLLYDSQDTVIEMFIEVLCIDEGGGASRALASGILAIACQLPGRACWTALAAVGGCLFNTMDGGQVSLEDVGAVETLLCSRA